MCRTAISVLTFLLFSVGWTWWWKCFDVAPPKKRHLQSAVLSRVFKFWIFIPFGTLSLKITMLLYILDGRIVYYYRNQSDHNLSWILLLLLSFIWSFIFLLFTLFANSISSRFCLIRSLLTLIGVACVSVELWNLWQSSSISNSPTTSLFSLLHTFVSYSLFLVYLFSLTVKF